MKACQEYKQSCYFKLVLIKKQFSSYKLTLKKNIQLK